jgi:RHS repeat-associated protein
MSPQLQYAKYYEYDGAGNRTLLRHTEDGSETLTYYEYNQANELTSLHDSSGWTYFAYDANGNTVQEQKPTFTRYYDWDGRDMMVGVRSTEAGWTDNVYRYTGTGSRVSTLESIGLTYYDWDGINVLQEKDATNTVTDRQVHGYAPIRSVGDIALMDKAGTPYVPVADQVGTTWGLVDSSGARVNYYQYDAFGLSRGVSESISNLSRFGTKRLDASSDLYHFIARQYEPGIGIFMSADPEGSLSYFRSYGYVFARPTGMVDPTGRWSVGDHWGMTQAAAEEVVGKLVGPFWGPETWSKREIISTLVSNNILQDVLYSWDLRRHYNRAVGDPGSVGEVAYVSHVRGEITQFALLLGSSPPECREALEALARALHSYQDFYAHAIRRDGQGGKENSSAPGWVAWTAKPPVTGEPIDQNKFWPSSYQTVSGGKEGEHPTGDEPLIKGGAEYNARYSAAYDYSLGILEADLNHWALLCLCRLTD